MKDDICNCGCHTHPEVIHFFPCCHPCPKCKARIQNGAFVLHVRECVTPLSINADWAVRILNYHNHRGHNGWYIENNYYYVIGKDQYDILNIFEAIAIAREYDRVNKDA